MNDDFDAEGFPPDSFGYRIRRLRWEAVQADAGHLVDQVDALVDDIARRRDASLTGETEP